MLLVVIVSKQVGTGQLVLHCSAAALSPSAFNTVCLGKGGCLWCLGGVWVVSGCCQRGNSAKTSENSSTGTISCNN